MKTIFRSLLLSLAATFPLHAAILTVDNNPGAVAMFDNFEDAYEAASDGDTILLAGSFNNYGGHTLLKRLKVVGPGYLLEGNAIPGLSSRSAQIAITCSVGSPLVGGTAANSEFIGLELGISVETGVPGIRVSKCHVSSSVRSSATFRSPVVVSKSYFTTPIFFSSGSSGSVISNSILDDVSISTTGISVDRCVITFSFNGNTSTSIANSIFVFSSASNFTQNSTSVANCMAVGFNTLPAGGGNINGQLIGNVFLNTGSNDGKWRLKAGSPALGAGTSGSDMGAFGGTNPYVLSGVPGIPRLTRLVVPATATSTSGLQFEVDAQAFPE
jgi:hypothetical protein